MDYAFSKPIYHAIRHKLPSTNIVKKKVDHHFIVLNFELMNYNTKKYKFQGTIPQIMI